jgi:hypothetical protein
MPEMDKIVPFLGGAGGSAFFLWAAWYFLQRQERDVAATRARADAFGGEMFTRWEKCDHCLTKWRDAYLGLWHDCPAAIQERHPAPSDLEDDE